jgi:hypothetical protein
MHQLRLEVEITLAENPIDNVILLPKTIDFYQIEITRMLEMERYEEAMELLRFLGRCNSGDARTDEEWRALLAWLETMQPGKSADDPVEEEEETEADLFRQHLRMKTENEPEYTTQLLEMLRPEVTPDMQLLSLEQLAYLEEPVQLEGKGVTESLVEWLQNSTVTPWVQFKALQTLKIRGFNGQIRVLKLGVPLTIDVARVPLEMKQYPLEFIAILNKLQQVAEVNEPTLVYFAEQIWEQFLAYIYGTATYEQLENLDRALTNVWAAALHCVLADVLSGTVNEIEIQQLYEITSDLKLQMKQAYQTVRSFADTFPFALK